MIKIQVMTNSGRSDSYIYGLNTTPYQVLEDRGIDKARKTISIDGRPLSPNECEETFEEQGYGDGAEILLTAIVKADSAC